jgi:hypothetical protein
MASSLCCGMGGSKADDVTPPYHAPSESKTVGDNSVPYSFQIDYPRIGNIKLGMNKKEVLKNISVQPVSKHYSYNVDELIFTYNSPVQGKAILDVVLQKDRAIQIATTDHRYRTIVGRNFFDNMQTIKASASQNGLEVKNTSYYFSLNKGTKKIDFYDVYSKGTAAGMAFIVIPAKKEPNIVNDVMKDMGYSGVGGIVQSNSPIPNYVVIHSSHRPVVGILNGLRGSSTPPKNYKPRRATQSFKKVSLTKKQQAEALKALNSLRALESAVSVATYLDFSHKLVDTKIVVDNSLRSIPKSDLKNEISSSIFAYTQVQSWWQKAINSDEDYQSDFDLERAANSAKAASEHIRNIEKMLK